jgi:hypothetical protein
MKYNQNLKKGKNHWSLLYSTTKINLIPHFSFTNKDAWRYQSAAELGKINNHFTGFLSF